MHHQVIPRMIAKILVPFIQLYALYVIAHGESSPGGGFQGGVLLGSSLVLYMLVFGVKAGRRRIKERISDVLTAVGVLIYGGIGLICLLLGGHYLEYDVLPFCSIETANHLGILGIEIGVGITVAMVMTTLYIEIVRRDDE